MLINMIGTDEEHVVDFETWKSEPFTDPTHRETLAMAIQAAVASFAVGPPDASLQESVMSEVGSIVATADGERDARTDAA